MINKKKLTTISSAILTGAVIMAALLLFFQPKQFDAEISKTVSSVIAQRSDLTLLILTDLHYDPGKYNAETGEMDVFQPTFSSIAAVASGVKKKGDRIDGFWNLGDFINGHGTTKAEATGQIKTVTAAQAQVSPDFHSIAGNHDNNIHATWYDPPQPESEVLSTEEVNALLENTATLQVEHHNPGFQTDYYVDFDTIRVVCLTADNTTFRQETADWLKAEALNTDKAVFFLAHIPTRPEWGFLIDVENGEAIEDAIRSFINSGGTVIAYIHGHDHGDMINTVTDEQDNLLWHEICIGCARFQYPTSNGTEGMTFRERNKEDETALLFDIVSIDQEKKTVHFTRFGAGEDREITYGQ